MTFVTFLMQLYGNEPPILREIMPQVKENNDCSHSNQNILLDASRNVPSQDLSDRFLCNGKKVTLKLLSDDKYLVVEQRSGGKLLSLFPTNLCQESDVISIENIVLVRGKDSYRVSKTASNQRFTSTRDSSKPTTNVSNDWLRWNKTLTTSSLCQNETFPSVPIDDKEKFLEAINFQPPIDQKCGAGIIINYIKKASDNTWKIKKLTFHHPDHQVVAVWRDRLEQAVLKCSVDRPKKLLIFVNPFGGRGKAKNIFDSKVAPLLRLCGVRHDVVITERANHASEMLQECNLEGVDGVVSVGGDGMFSEIFTGMLLRNTAMKNGNIHELRKGKIRVGMIPAGELNT